MSQTTSPTIDLIIPGLLNLPVHELSADKLLHSTPNLHKFLRYATRENNTLTDFDDILIQRLGLKQAALPYAHAIRPDQLSTQMLIKPVHLKADMNNAMVYPLRDCDKEIIHIINDLKEFFKDNCNIEVLPDKNWMMTLSEGQPVTDVPHYLSALGKKVTHYLEQAKTNLQWFKLFNEMQMFLYQHEVNQQRQQNRQPLINSLWCWGADKYQGEKITNTLWFSDDDDVQKIGDLYTGQSASIDDLLNADIKSDAVIVDLSILKLLKGQNDRELGLVLHSVEQNCFEPLMKYRKHKIILHTGGPNNFQYHALMALKFWKKKIELDKVILQGLSQ